MQICDISEVIVQTAAKTASGYHWNLTVCELMALWKLTPARHKLLDELAAGCNYVFAAL